MLPRGSFRLILYLAYLCALFAFAAGVYARIQRFDGMVLVVKGSAEGIAVCPARDSFSLAAGERNLPAEIIHFDNPQPFRRFLGDQEMFDAVRMPFRLQLDAIDVLEERPPREIIEVLGKHPVVSCEARAGVQIPVEGPALQVKEIRPWVGLLRNPQGRPMTALSIRKAGSESWTGPIFLDAGSWRFVEPGIALRLGWFRSEAEARKSLPQNLDALQGARWGVVDGKKFHGFQSFSPGTGVTLDDGTEVTLLKHDPEHPGEHGPAPAILVELKRTEGVENLWAPVNTHEPNATIRYVDPARANTVVTANAWRDGTALLAAFQDRLAFGNRLLAEGEVWRPMIENPGGAGFPYEIRLDQAMAAALPILPGGDPVWEALVTAPGEEIRLREGEAVTWKDLRLRYRRMPTPPRVRQHFTVTPRSGGKPWTFDLGPGKSRRVGDWRFSQIPEHVDAAHSALLRAERTLGGKARLAGAILFIAGAFGLVLLRFRRASTAATESTDPDES
jgi:hypothetical protein